MKQILSCAAIISLLLCRCEAVPWYDYPRYNHPMPYMMGRPWEGDMMVFEAMVHPVDPGYPFNGYQLSTSPWHQHTAYDTPTNIPSYGARDSTYPMTQNRMEIPSYSQVMAPGYTRSNGYPVESHVQTNQAYDQRNNGYSTATESRNGLRPQQMRPMYQNY